MFRQIIAAVAAVAAVVFAVLPASAQQTEYGAWIHNITEDDFSGENIETASTIGEDGNLILYVLCLPVDEVFRSYEVAIAPIGNRIFRNRIAELRWDDGEVEAIRFQHINNDNALTTGDDWILGSIISTQLGAECPSDWNRPGSCVNSSSLSVADSDLRVRVTFLPNTRVTDRFSLSGASRAIDAMQSSSCPGS